MPRPFFKPKLLPPWLFQLKLLASSRHGSLAHPHMALSQSLLLAQAPPAMVPWLLLTWLFQPKLLPPWLRRAAGRSGDGDGRRGAAAAAATGGRALRCPRSGQRSPPVVPCRALRKVDEGRFDNTGSIKSNLFVYLLNQ